MVLGIDLRSTVASFLRGQLYSATITRRVPGSYDVNNPSAGPETVNTVYQCDAQSFQYDEDLIPGEQIKNTNFLVKIILGSVVDATSKEPVDYTPQPGDTISIPPPSSTSPVDAIVSGVRSKSETSALCVVGGQLVDG